MTDQSFESRVNLALAEFEEWADGRELPDVEEFIADLSIPADVADQVREYLAREKNLHCAIHSNDIHAAATDQAVGQVGSLVDRYKLIRKLGQGGMGTVWLAEQHEPVKRQVALKLIRFGFDSNKFIQRFEAERQLLAVMDHPNIAKVLDAGTTDQGLPFLVMELVDGRSINRYCDEHCLSIKERLELFITVCNAVQHAHQKGIIHRDLKPSNVIVAQYDGKPIAKIIDFGLAKAFEQEARISDESVVTHVREVVGTLLYMSPEQAESNTVDVDTRTDIYSLGVMLYELLTGSTPIERATAEKHALLQVLQYIKETEPPRPSNRLSDSDDSASGISEQRKIQPDRLRQLLRGELDWVVMKAIEKDRNRRYSSASEFAEDVQRFLNNDVVSARLPTFKYRMGKFVRRNRGAVAAASAFAILLLILIVLLTEMLRQKTEMLRQKIIAATLIENSTQQGFDAIEDLTADISQNLIGSEELSFESEDDLSKRVNAANAINLTRIGLYLEQIGTKPEERLKWYEDAIKRFESMEQSQLAKYLYIYGTTLQNAGVHCVNLEGQRERAKGYFEKAIKAREQYLNSPNQVEGEVSLAQTLLNAANVADSEGRLTRALELLTGNESLKAKRLLGKIYYNRGFDGKTDEKKNDVNRAVKIFEDIVTKQGKNPHQQDLSALAQAYDVMLEVSKKPMLQHEYLLKATATFEKLLQSEPNSSFNRSLVATLYHNLGNRFFDRDKDFSTAIKQFDKAARQFEKVDDSTIKKMAYYKTYLGRAESNLNLGQLTKAQRDYEVLIPIAEGNLCEGVDQWLTFIKIRRLRCLMVSDIDTTIEELGKISDLFDKDYQEKAVALITAAGIYSLACEQTDENDQKKEFSSAALNILNRMQELGILTDIRVEQIVADTDFDGIRDLPEFQTLLNR